ncbi:hypothetical protein [Ramlibacter albus]|uniref:Uncharacterized protein n=1 Tax=Ramlibacter albus TaxID=2079448 RepID=A0A923M8J7_9BURK|nr:hypothetical protein [Ramlibacter albus]MBC5765676.1 hypothetical protein [Ramlibacter albus]
MKRPELPGHELFVSTAAGQGEVLTLRFISDMLPGAPPSAYVLHAFECMQPEVALAFVRRVMDAGRMVQLSWRAERLVLSTSEREEYLLTARRFTGKPAEPSMAELADAMKRVYACYLAANKASRRSVARLQRVRDLLLEQARRMRGAAAGHGPDSELAAVYAQHAEFIERLFNETEA